ncbi:MAG TPA: hypothetical protein VIS57_02190, partial [Xanthomonadales bacterium]
MTDPTGFSLGMSVNPASTFKPLPDWVAFDLCQAYPVPGGNLLLHNTQNGKRAMVKPEVFSALLHCGQFKTLDQHAATIIELNPAMQGQQADIRKVLSSMLDGGILLSAKSVCDKLKSKVDSGTEEKERPGPVVTILTWERPQALERLLESIAANCNTENFQRIYVIDDSRKAENIRQNQKLTERFVSRIAAPIQYFGQSEQLDLLDKLVARLPQHENAIRFLIDRPRWKDFWTAGLTRNLALLLSPGNRLVMIDDDAICDVYDPPRQKPDISFSDDPREAVFFGNEQEWAHLRQPINPDPISRHMQCLGLTFSEALSVLGQNHLKPAGFKNATALELSELKNDSEVLLTECGSLGCPGTANNNWLPDMAPDSLQRMLASEEKTAQALGSRKVWSGRSHPHFAPRSNMSQITGFDNRRMLPPYLPIIRGEDRLFGYMLDFIFPTAVTLDYPWAVPHLPVPDRRWRDRDLNFTPADSFPVFFIEKIIESKSSCHATGPDDRLASLSLWFSDMAAASAESLVAMYRDSRLRGDSERLRHLTALLEKNASAPVNWQNYLRNGIAQLNADLDLASRNDFVVRGLPASMETDELIAFWRKVWSDFAATLKAWREIRDAAANLASSA